MFRYLNIVEQLPMYGVHYYNVKTKVISDLHGKFKYQISNSSSNYINVKDILC